MLSQGRSRELQERDAGACLPACLCVYGYQWGSLTCVEDAARCHVSGICLYTFTHSLSHSRTRSRKCAYVCLKQRCCLQPSMSTIQLFVPHGCIRMTVTTRMRFPPTSACSHVIRNSLHPDDGRSNTATRVRTIIWTAWHGTHTVVSIERPLPPSLPDPYPSIRSLRCLPQC